MENILLNNDLLSKEVFLGREVKRQIAGFNTVRNGRKKLNPRFVTDRAFLHTRYKKFGRIIDFSAEEELNLLSYTEYYLQKMATVIVNTLLQRRPRPQMINLQIRQRVGENKLLVRFLIPKALKRDCRGYSAP